MSENSVKKENYILPTILGVLLAISTLSALIISSDHDPSLKIGIEVTDKVDQHHNRESEDMSHQHNDSNHGNHH